MEELQREVKIISPISLRSLLLLVSSISPTISCSWSPALLQIIRNDYIYVMKDVSENFRHLYEISG